MLVQRERRSRREKGQDDFLLRVTKADFYILPWGKGNVSVMKPRVGHGGLDTKLASSTLSAM
jgi:hypothetical protein